jgi:ATP-dependent protease ClpP protease subunit
MSEKNIPNPMAENQVYLMSPIFDFTTEDFCRAVACVPKNEDMTVLMNCPGGSVFAGWTAIGVLKERTGKNNFKVYGHAASMAMFMLLYADNVKALEVTKFLIHRADGYIENEDEQKLLDSINKDLRTQMESKLDMEKFTKVTNYTMDDVFNGKEVKDVWISAKDAKKIGLVNEVIRLQPEEMKAFNEKFVAYVKPIQGSTEPQGSGDNKTNTNNNNSPIPKKMTRDELKAQHPDIYSAILAEGQSAERERVQAWLAFIDYDKDNVIASIKDPAKAVNGAVMAEMTVKITAAVKVNALVADGKTPPVATGEAKDKTEEETAKEDFTAKVKAGIKDLKYKVF